MIGYSDKYNQLNIPLEVEGQYPIPKEDAFQTRNVENKPKKSKLAKIAQVARIQHSPSKESNIAMGATTFMMNINKS